jgi:hypothetical protein
LFYLVGLRAPCSIKTYLALVPEWGENGFSKDKLRIDVESSKLSQVSFQMIGEHEHLLVLQTVTRDQTGKFKWQVTMDAPPFQFIESSAHLTVIVLPERHWVISGLKKTTYLPGDKLSINCTSNPSYPSAKLSWFLNKKKVDRWMVTSFLPLTNHKSNESSTLGLNFLVLPEMELWATCKAAMPSIHGVELPIEQILLLGSLNNKLQYYQGGWAAAEAGLNCDGKMLKLLLLMMIVMVTIIRRDRTQLWKHDSLVTLDEDHGEWWWASEWSRQGESKYLGGIGF